MTTAITDDSVLHRIDALVHEEQHLYATSDLPKDARARLAAIQVELDQSWDLLRQRRAQREFGGDPNDAQERPASVVERYEQ
jgi:hypothetical protein